MCIAVHACIAQSAQKKLGETKERKNKRVNERSNRGSRTHLSLCLSVDMTGRVVLADPIHVALEAGVVKCRKRRLPHRQRRCHRIRSRHTERSKCYYQATPAGVYPPPQKKRCKSDARLWRGGDAMNRKDRREDADEALVDTEWVDDDRERLIGRQRIGSILGK